MGPSDKTNIRQIAGRESAPAGAATVAVDARQTLMGAGLEFSRRILETSSPDDLYFLLTNDLRALIDFDRSFLVTHVHGSSKFVAASNQPILEKKAKFYGEIERLGIELRNVRQPMLISNTGDIKDLPDDKISPAAKDAVMSYMDFADCKAILCIPLMFNNEPLGHLVLEYIEKKIPDQARILTLVKIAPFLASALFQCSVVAENPALASIAEVDRWWRRPAIRRLKVFVPIAVLAAIGLVYLFVIMPFPFTVGGEAEIIAHERHVAFCKIDGLVDRIYVAEGSHVTKDQVLASLDPKELDYKIKMAQRKLELLVAEMKLLKKSVSEDLAKLAESQLVELKIKSTWAELEYLKWQRQFLDIKAPVEGVILTKHIETLAGKKFNAGEVFCEIAVPGDLWTEIFVPEDKISYVKAGQKAEVFLNSDPFKGYALTVKEVAPRAEAIPRLGNIFRVKGTFEGDKPPMKVGLKGIGKIYTKTSNLWSIVSQRLRTRWNQLSLYFS